LKLALVFIGVLVYASLNAYLTAGGTYHLTLLPIMVVFFYILVAYPQGLFFTVVFLTPFSILYYVIDEHKIAFPTEPIIWSLMVLYVLKQIMENTFDKRILRHPITIIILIHFAWMLMACFTSSMPYISFKYFFSRFWYVIVFYFMGLEVFRNYANIKKFFWLYIIGLSAVIVYVIPNHLLIGLSRDTSHLASQPFFKDHTIYGATVALLLPATIIFFRWKRPFGHDTYKQVMAGCLIPLYAIALFFSYSRAAWLSVVLALAASFIFWLRIRFITVISTAFIVIGLITIFWVPIKIFFKENKTTSASSPGVIENIQSIYNITNDASNTERINRWYSAYRMFEARPVFGFGPGTYQFQYAPFQRHYQQTKISTNFGEQGNAHSEYLGPLAEYGLVGSLSKVLLMFMVIYYGMNLYYRGKNETVRITALTVLLCLLTYFTHGFLNNFLNYDKASVPFWGLIAMLVALDTFFNKPPEAFEEEGARVDDELSSRR